MLVYGANTNALHCIESPRPFLCSTANDPPTISNTLRLMQTYNLATALANDFTEAAFPIVVAL